MNAAHDERARLPIGLFDSGVGGLTVLDALRKRLPNERYCFLGDTARLPYGTKGSDTIIRYSLQASARLVERDIKLLVVACNTATAAALPELQREYAPLPVIGVVEPGARSAVAAAQGKDGDIIVLATESTIKSGAYTKAIHALCPEADVRGVAASLLVPLAEEGWGEGPIAEAIIKRYLEPELAKRLPACIVLACTHFPILQKAIAAVVGPDVTLVDSAATAAEAAERELAGLGLLAPQHTEAQKGPSDPRLHFLTTDAPERFARVGGLFLGTEICPDMLELVVL